MKTIWILGLTTALVFCALCGYVIYDTRREAVGDALKTNVNLVQVISQDISRNFEMYDLSIQGVIEGLAQPDIDQVSPTIRRMALFNNVAKASYLDRIAIMDINGKILDQSVPSAKHDGDFSDREYFRIHKERNDAGLYVSKPYESRLTPGQWVIALSRRIPRSDGSFGGIVVGFLDVDYFESLFANIDAGPLDRFAVLRTDGTLILGHPFKLRNIGRDLSRAALFQHFPATRSGSYDFGSLMDGIRRVYSFGQVGNLPLVVCVGSAESTIYDAWLRKAMLVGILMAGLAAAMAALGICLVRELDRRRRTEQKLESLAAALAVTASTDGLTGLANRRYFDEIAEIEWKRAIRSGEPISIAVVDVDFFKAFNDACGHLSGDDALKGVASCIRTTLTRSSDFAARYGGEEFALLLPSMHAWGALHVAETLRAAIAKKNIYHPSGVNYRISVSIGITTVTPRVGDPFPQAFAAADRALFRAKQLGRNRVEHSDSNMQPAPSTLATPELELPMANSIH